MRKASLTKNDVMVDLKRRVAQYCDTDAFLMSVGDASLSMSRTA